MANKMKWKWNEKMLPILTIVLEKVNMLACTYLSKRLKSLEKVVSKTWWTPEIPDQNNCFH